MYDTIIIGAGAAGLGAAVYTRRFDLSTLVLGELPGGTITKTHLVENYPGFSSISGLGLGQAFLAHVATLGVEPTQTNVTAAVQTADGFQVTTEDGQAFTGKTLIIATGTDHRHLGVPGETEFTNRGVSYCATCDAPFFKKKTVAIIGGSDSAVKESLILAEHAAKVYIIYRRDKLRAEPINIRRMEAKSNIEVIYNANVTEVYGTKTVEGVKLDTGRDLPLAGVFVEIGRLPRSDIAKQLGCELAANGEVITDRYSRTNVPGVFAAGDVTNTDWKQAITGVAEGAHAANQVFEYLQRI